MWLLVSFLQEQVANRPEAFQKSPALCSCPPGGQPSEDPVCHLPQPVTLTKAVRDRLSLIHQITSPRAVSVPWGEGVTSASLPHVEFSLRLLF